MTSPVLRNVANKSIIVTGGCSGLGLATAKRLAKLGAHVTMLDLHDNANAIGEMGDHWAQFVKCDVTNADSVKAAIEATVKKFGAVHGAVNCAGIAPPAKILGKKGVHDLGLFQKVINVNLVGTFNVMRLAAEEMLKNAPETFCPHDGERGVIVMTASIAAFEGQIGQCAYAASKGGVVGLTLPAARELAAHQIRVNTIAPGIMGTPMLAGLPPAAQESLGQAVPFPKRMGSPQEYASLVEHIFTNGYLNGEVIRLDGCLRMQ